jgi:hypothetical protein
VAYWIKLTFERNNYVIDLDRIAAFCQSPNSRISFVLPDSNLTIVVNQQSDPETYQQILDFIHERSGYSLN